MWLQVVMTSRSQSLMYCRAATSLTDGRVMLPLPPTTATCHVIALCSFFTLPRVTYCFSGPCFSVSFLSALQDKKLSCLGDRAMLRVTEYFAKSLGVIRSDTLESLLALHCNYCGTVSGTFGVKYWRALKMIISRP